MSALLMKRSSSGVAGGSTADSGTTTVPSLAKLPSLLLTSGMEGEEEEELAPPPTPPLLPQQPPPPSVSSDVEHSDGGDAAPPSSDGQPLADVADPEGPATTVAPAARWNKWGAALKSRWLSTTAQLSRSPVLSAIGAPLPSPSPAAPAAAVEVLAPVASRREADLRSANFALRMAVLSAHSAAHAAVGANVALLQEHAAACVAMLAQSRMEAILASANVVNARKEASLWRTWGRSKKAAAAK